MGLSVCSMVKAKMPPTLEFKRRDDAWGQHHLVDGKDRCTCILKVLWLTGPNANKRTTISCYNIRLLSPGCIETHPVINDFVKLVEAKMNRNPRKRKIARNTGVDFIGKKVDPAKIQGCKELENVAGSTSVSELPNELGTRCSEAGLSHSWTRFKNLGLHPLSTTSVNKGIDSIGNKVNPATTQAYKKLENVVGSSSASELPNELGIKCAEPGFSHSWPRFKSHGIHPFPATSVNAGIDSIGNKVNLATSQACKELDNIDSISNRVNLVTSQACKELDNTRPGGNFSPAPLQACKEPNIIAGFIEYVRPSADGYHESQERCDNIIKESSAEEGADFYASQILVLDNIEKDISSSAVVRYISGMTSLVVQVLIFPCPRSQGFRRGFVWFKDQASLLRVYTLLQDDNFFIVSSKGRPWVVSIIENGDDGRYEGILGAMTLNSQSQEPKASSGTLGAKKIWCVRKGTAEYVKAKQKKERFLEYREQVRLLHRGADYE